MGTADEAGRASACGFRRRGKLTLKVLLVSSLTAIASLMFVGGASAANPVPSASSAWLASGSQPFTLTNSAPAPNGQVVTTWTGSGATAGITSTITAAPGSIVSLVPSTTPNYRYEVVVTPPQLASTKSIPASELTAAGLSKTGAATRALGVAAAQTACGQTGLNIPKGCIYNEGNITNCLPAGCVWTGYQQQMLQNIAHGVNIAQTYSGTVYNNNGLVQFGEAYSRWPGSTGDQLVNEQPQGFTTQYGQGTTINVGFNAFGFSLGGSVTIAPNSTYGPIRPSGPTQPAFGAQWQSGYNPVSGLPYGTLGSGLGSVGQVLIGAGQSDFCEWISGVE
jgi:hypothetical protein